MLIEIAGAGIIQCLEVGEEHRERERERDLKNKRMALTLTHSIRKGTRVKLNLKYKNSSRSKYYIQLLQKCFPLSLRSGSAPLDVIFFQLIKK